MDETLDEDHLETGSPENIFKRLGKIASVNLVAFSEGGVEKIIQPNDLIVKNVGTESMRCQLNNNNFDDTGFVCKLFNENDKELTFNNGSKSFHKGNRIFSNSKYMETNQMNILNVHLPSNGPGETIVPKEDMTYYTHQELIEKFCEQYLPSPKELNSIPDIIVGDTNITCSKCLQPQIFKDGKPIDPPPPIKRSDLMYCLKKSIYNIYENSDSVHDWGLIMSRTKIKKMRSYGFLLNQQINKSNIDTHANEDRDGTIIAFRYLKKNLEPSSENKDRIDLISGKFFGDNFEILFERMLYIGTMPRLANGKIIPTLDDPESVSFLHFDTPIDDCLYTLNDDEKKIDQLIEEELKKAEIKEIEEAINYNKNFMYSAIPQTIQRDERYPIWIKKQKNGMLIDRLFIDHSPLQFSYEGIMRICRPTVELPQLDKKVNTWKNLIVLNLGSIINSGNKDWNTDKMRLIPQIKIIDKDLFDEILRILLTNTTNKPLPSDKDNYEKFDGKLFGKFVLTNANIPLIAKAMKDAHIAIINLFSKNNIKGGTKPKMKRKFKSRIDKTKKIKRKTKRIRKQYKY